MRKLASSVLCHLRQSELRLAKSILRWKLQKEGQPMPSDSKLDDAAPFAGGKANSQTTGNEVAAGFEGGGKGVFRF